MSQDVPLEQPTSCRPLLFERHWMDQPVRSWWSTFVGGLRPGRFWRGVSIDDRIKAGALWLAISCAPLLFLLTLNILLRAFTAVATSTWAAIDPDEWPASATVAEYASFHLRGHVAGMLDSPRGVALLLCGWLPAPPMAVLALAWMARRIGGVPISKAQMLRVVGYSAGPLAFWLAGLLALSFAASSLAHGLNGLVTVSQRSPETWMQPHIWPIVDEAVWLAFLAVLLLCLLLYLRAAMRHYLRLPRPTWIAGASLGIVAVPLVLAATVVFAVIFRQYW